MNTSFDNCADQFENELRSGGSPLIEAYLSQLPEDSKQRILHELISLEVFYRLKQGLPIKISHYARFGQSAAMHAEQAIEEISNPADEVDASEAPTIQPFKTSGRYRLVQQIGEGGMGTVWMAEQEEPIKRCVALKLIKPELISNEVIARFQAEKQALAMMDHRNIARVLDAGTTDSGSPYFAMELVRGIPITEYCNDNKLSVDDRLELFVPVCKAVQHAHQKGILHRDLKPSNVLVTVDDGEAVPKVIDFGLAKATEHHMKLTDKTLFTEFGKVVGTLQYMSPEQAEMNGLDVDPRTDIYSLGVMLYELLTGSTPIDKETLGGTAFLQVLEIIREKEPPRPSNRLSSSTNEASSRIGDQRKIGPAKLQRILQGELDWVVMKALEKDRTRRYQTANDFSKDISNFLTGEAVDARPPSTWYQIQKYATRNRGTIASAVAIAGAVLLGIAGTSYGLHLANQAHENQSSEIATKSENSEAIENKGWTESETANKVPADIRWDARRSESDITCNGHQGWVYRIAFSPDGQRLASASSDKTIKLWNARTGEEITTLNGHEKRVGSVAFSPDGTRLASASYDRTIKLWDLKSNQEITTITAHTGTVADVAFSPHGQYLASASDDKTIKLWNAKTGYEIITLEGHTAEVGRIAFSPNGERLASASVDKTIKLWDVESGKEVATIKGHDHGVGSVAFSVDGETIASTCKNIIKLWDVQTGQEITTLAGHAGWIHNVAFSPDGKHLASASSDKTIKLWDVQTGQEITTLNAHTNDVISVAFSPNGTWLASAGFDATIKLWNAR